MARLYNSDLIFLLEERDDALFLNELEKMFFNEKPTPGKCRHNAKEWKNNSALFGYSLGLTKERYNLWLKIADRLEDILSWEEGEVCLVPSNQELIDILHLSDDDFITELEKLSPAMLVLSSKHCRNYIGSEFLDKKTHKQRKELWLLIGDRLEELGY